MAGFGTVNAKDQSAWQMTFPAVFTQAQKAKGLKEAQGPSALGFGHVEAGADFQAHYHEQKRQEANRRVAHALRDTKAAEIRAFTSAHGVPGMPKAVLGQRRFANPSLGAYGDSSARRDQGGPFRLVEAAVEGGVLRTREGQQHNFDRLAARVRQLNQIDAASDLFNQGMEGAVPAQAERLDINAEERLRIEFNLARQALIDSLTVGRTDNISLDQVNRFLILLFRLAPVSDADELDDIYQGFDLALMPLIRQLNDDDYDPPNEDQFDEQVAFSMMTLLDKAVKYVEGMVDGSRRGLSPAEMRKLSQALIRTQGFAKFVGIKTPDADLTARQRQRKDNVDDSRPADQFSRPAAPREDTQQAAEGYAPGSRREFFDSDVRNEFADQSGTYAGETAPAPQFRPKIAKRTNAVAAGPDAEDEAAAEAPAPAAIAQEEEEEIEVPELEEAPAPAPVARRRGEVLEPKTVAELDQQYPDKKALKRLAKALRKQGKKDIRIFDKSTLANVRSRFIKALGLK